MHKLFLGTSGYNYRGWKEKFYPPNLPQREWLSYFATKFDTVEINNSFYVAVRTETYTKWYDQTPKDFTFVIKGHRYITQLKKLHEVEEAVESFFAAASSLKEKLSVVLWQFPASFKLHGHETEFTKRLEKFLKLLPREYRYAFEFRDPSWFTTEINQLLKQYNSSLVISQSAKFPEIVLLNNTFAYVRFHGPQALYSSSYSDEALQHWARKIGEWRQSQDVYGYFNNDAGGHALKNAETLRNYLSL